MSDTTDIHTAKQALRTAMKALRASTPAASRQIAAEAIAREALALIHVSSLAGRDCRVVSAFLSIGDELDTGPLLRRLHSAGHALCLPVMQGKRQPLTFRQWAPGDAMDTKIWGIQEPKPSAPDLLPAVMLVPLLAADRRGHRLGYGGGFYDRTIDLHRKLREVLTVGLCFDAQLVDAVPHLDYDQPLDWLLTPSGAIRCQPNAR